MRRALEYAVSLPGAVLAQHAEDPSLAARWPHARGRVVEPSRHSRAARRRGIDDHRARHRPRRAHRCARPLPARLDRGSRRPRARREGPGDRGHGRGRTAPLHPHRRVLRRLRSCVQGPPAAAHRCRRRGDQARPRRRHHRRDRHRSRSAHPRGQGADVRGGAPGNARPRDRARPHPHRARRAGCRVTRRRARPAVVATRRHRRDSALVVTADRSPSVPRRTSA